jgi:hypothetical protein
MDSSGAWLVTGNGPMDRRQAVRHALLEDYATTEFESVEAPSEKPLLAFYEPWLLELLYKPSKEPVLVGAAGLGAPLQMEVREDPMEPTNLKRRSPLGESVLKHAANRIAAHTGRAVPT